MNVVDHLLVEAPDPGAADLLYRDVLGLGGLVRARAATAPAPAFRGFTLSLVVAQPSTVDALVSDALDAGATSLKTVARSFWGYGGVVRTPDGTVVKVASSSKKEVGPPSRQVDGVVLLLGAADVAASRRCYVDRGFTVAKSFGRRYVEFAATASPVTLALYGRRGLARDAGVPPDEVGAPGLVVVGGPTSFSDPDGFVWQAVPTASGTGDPAVEGRDRAGRVPAPGHEG